MKIISFYLAVFLSALLISCDAGKDSGGYSSKEHDVDLTPDKPTFYIKSPRNDDQVTMGDTLHWQLKFYNASLDSLHLYHHDTYINTFFDEEFYFTSRDIPAGKQLFSLKVFFDGKEKTKDIEIIFLPSEKPSDRSYQIKNVYPHDPEAYTQGFEFYEGRLFESTGQYGSSEVREIDVLSGKIIQSSSLLDNEFFGEGITILNDKIYQLTWKGEKGFIYDLNLKKEGDFDYPVSTEGWGLSHIGDTLMMSDGSEKIYFIDSRDFSVMKTLEVYNQRGPVKRLNELEYIEGYIYANVYMEDFIVKIDPETGVVLEKIDLSNLLDAKDHNVKTDVLNGIAYDKSTGKLYVTGKNWPKIFEIEVK